MIQLPAEWLEKQFDTFLKRGAIIHFYAEDLTDPKNKFALVLNGKLPEPEIFYVFATSQTAFYDKHPQFEPALLRLDAGEYCFTKPTIIPLRDIRSIPAKKLKVQYASGRLQFHGPLSDDHLKAVDQIIAHGLFISPRLQAFILPDGS